MKKKLSYIVLALAGILLASCMGDDYAGARYDENPYGNNELTEDNVITIAALKDMYKTPISTDYRDGQAYEQVTSNLKINALTDRSVEHEASVTFCLTRNNIVAVVVNVTGINQCLSVTA